MSEPVSTSEGGPPSDRPAAVLSRAEFAAEFDRCWRTLWCIAAGVLGDRSHAEDVVQEAALIAMDKLDEFDPGTNLTAWMARIVRNVALNHARRRKLERSWAASARDEALRAGHAAGREIANSSAEVDDEEVMEALGILSDTARTCLLMRTVLGLSYKEIAAALEIPAGTAMSHVHRARAGLREHLASRGTHDSAGKGLPA